MVVVSFNTRALLERCLGALETGTGAALQVIVVDNASTDGSSALVRERFPDAELIEQPENAGFARAGNIAFERCRAPFILLLNPDAFVHAGAIDALLATAARHPRAAAVGPRLYNEDGTLQRSAWPFPNPTRLLIEAVGLHRVLRRTPFWEDLGSWGHEEERAVDFLIGACLLLRAEALAEVGGFDERFWLYGEEADLQRRLAARGWSVVLSPDAGATHIGRASEMAENARLFHFYSGQRSFLRKHGGRGARPVARCALLLYAVLRRRWRIAWVALRLR